MSLQKKIDATQTKLIHIAQAQLCLSDDNYRSIIAAQTKGEKHSSKDLTYWEADAVINYFVKTLGFKIKSNYIRTAGAARRKRWQYANQHKGQKPPLSPFTKGGSQNENSPLTKGGSRGILPSNVFVLPSRDQLDMIEALVKKITWRFDDGYDRWRQKYIKTDRIKTADQASDTIEGLKGLLAHQEGKEI